MVAPTGSRAVLRIPLINPDDATFVDLELMFPFTTAEYRLPVETSYVDATGEACELTIRVTTDPEMRRVILRS